MQIAYHVMSSPVGLLFLARTERGLRYLEFMERKSLKRMIARHAEENPGAVWRPSLLELKPVVDQLEAYFNGTRTEFTVPLDPLGSEFQLRVWRELSRIPYGATRTYGEIAAAVEQPRGARAVGLANNQNPLAIIVPCHRVIGADGSMVGYGGGIARKKWLLDNEARFARPVGRTGDLFEAAALEAATTRRHAKSPATRPHAVAVAVAAKPAARRTPAIAAKTSARRVRPLAVAARAPAGRAAAPPAKASASATTAVASKTRPARPAAGPVRSGTRAATSKLARAARGRSSRAAGRSAAARKSSPGRAGGRRTAR